MDRGPYRSHQYYSVVIPPYLRSSRAYRGLFESRVGAVSAANTQGVLCVTCRTLFKVYMPLKIYC
ncbi:hypothetical protein BD309DRAFT_973630, partial [Dichomitus squalens]